MIQYTSGNSKRLCLLELTVFKCSVGPFSNNHHLLSVVPQSISAVSLGRTRKNHELHFLFDWHLEINRSLSLNWTVMDWKTINVGCFFLMILWYLTEIICIKEWIKVLRLRVASDSLMICTTVVLYCLICLVKCFKTHIVICRFSQIVLL